MKADHDIKKDRKSKKNRTKVGIKWKMFAILAVFIVIVLTVIWLFQVKMLNYFYLTTKFSELEESIIKIEKSLNNGDDDIRDTVFACSVEYYSSICVLEVESGKGNVIVEAKGSMDAVMPIMSDREMIKLCNLAYDNGGTYIATVLEEDISGNKKPDIFEEYEEDAIDGAMQKAKQGAVSAVYVKYIDVNGEKYFIIQSSDITPVQATVKTLQRQFLWIGIILLILALGLALIMAKVITKPIVKINEASKALAQGRYDADFSTNGYREIKELSDTLTHASEELAKTDRLQKELVSNVSHDLRTPLTMIKGYSEVMRDIPGENTPENVQVIIDETERLTELVNDMLDISKIRAGTRSPEMYSFNLTDTVRATMSRYEKLTVKDGYRIEFYSDRDAFVVADRSMILQVIYNLINNAVNYSGADKYVCVKQEIRENRVRVSVADTGEGIAPDQIPLIWERYYKVDKVHKRAEVGTGLGLSIVKGILELHGATYGVYSTVGVGSIFWFELELCGDIERESLTDGENS